MRSRTILFLLFLTGVIGLSLTMVSTPPTAAAVGTTYTVTSTSCTGPGSITEAMDMANNNTGTDTISITPGLQIDARLCPPHDIPSDPQLYFFLQADESVIIEGNGAKLTGKISFLDNAGRFVEGSSCHDEAFSTKLLASTPGFIRIGENGQDNSAITVTVHELTLDELASVAHISDNATLIMEDVAIRNIYSSTRNCDQSAVYARTRANFTARRTQWFNVWNNAKVYGAGTATNGAINGYGPAGDLTIENSEFDLIKESGTITWDGDNKVNIVSSRFLDLAGIYVSGSATTNIVNSILGDPFGFFVSPDARIVNESTGDMNLIASTVIYPTVACDDQCQSQDFDGGWSTGWFVRKGTGDINFVQSAVDVVNPNDKSVDDTYVKLLDSGVYDDPGDPVTGYKADMYTWIRETPLQDGTELKNITGQPGLLTALPALTYAPAGPQSKAATPLFPGTLIDTVPDAVCEQGGTVEAKALLNPIDGTCIELDALGNPRVDGNGNRNTGAVQLSLAPHLTVTGTGDQLVDLHWTKPQEPSGETLVGYLLTYREKGTTTWTEQSIAGPDTETAQVTGLTNGTEYEFQVRAVYQSTTQGPLSNMVTATPLGDIGAPDVKAVPRNKKVILLWTKPSDGGHQINAYHILWRPVGAPSWTGSAAVYGSGGNLPPTTYTVTGLKNGIKYEFAVSASAVDGVVGERGFARAKPAAPATATPTATATRKPTATPTATEPSATKDPTRNPTLTPTATQDPTQPTSTPMATVVPTRDPDLLHVFLPIIARAR